MDSPIHSMAAEKATPSMYISTAFDDINSILTQTLVDHKSCQL